MPYNDYVFRLVFYLVLKRGLNMLIIFICIVLLLLGAVWYYIRLYKDSMDVNKFIDLLYKDDEEN